MYEFFEIFMYYMHVCLPYRPSTQINVGHFFTPYLNTYIHTYIHTYSIHTYIHTYKHAYSWAFLHARAMSISACVH